MRLPYVCGQTGVAQKHYNTSKRASERMPGSRLGQVYTYPQKKWQKKNYQYLAHFMLPKHLRYAAEERAAMALQEHPAVTEESNSNSQDKWGDYYMNDDEYAMADPGSEPESDSDFEYEGRGAKRGKGRKSAMKTKPSRSSRSSRRMEEEAMSPVSDRKFHNKVFQTLQLKQMLQDQHGHQGEECLTARGPPPPAGRPA